MDNQLSPIYTDWIGKSQVGLCVDIGANDGTKWTQEFRKQNNPTIAIEPLPESVNKMRNIYNDDEEITIIEAAVGTNVDDYIFLTVPNDEKDKKKLICSADKDYIDAYLNEEDIEKRITVPTISLKEVEDSYGPIEVVKVDSEGMEEEILKGLFFLKCLPKYLMYESLPRLSKSNYNCKTIVKSLNYETILHYIHYPRVKTLQKEVEDNVFNEYRVDIFLRLASAP